MRSVEFLDYELPLSTGETISVAEADPGRVRVLADPAVIAAAEDVFGRCTLAPRDVVEEAKAGGTDGLESLLRTPPHGCLAKMKRPVCGEIATCVLADRRRCTAAGRNKRGPDFPLCWTFAVDPGVPAATASAARDLADSIVGAWKEGRYVLVVSGQSA